MTQPTQLGILGLALGVAAGSAPAQLSKGVPAPPLEIQAAFNGAPKNWTSLDGKVVLLKFFATY